MKKTKKEKKRLMAISLVLIALIGLLVESVVTNWPKILENNSELEELTAVYNDLLSEEEKLESEVTKLHDSDYVARYAKEKYMYSSEGETIIRID